MGYIFDTKTHPIRSMILEVQSVCNLNCKMCRFQEQERYSDFTAIRSSIKKVLSDVKRYYPDCLVEFISGEIFAAKRIIYPYLEYCKELGLKAAIVTNGTLITEQDVMFIKDVVGGLTISLDSMREDVHDFIRGKGVFKKVVALLDLLDRHAIPYYVTSVVSKLNIDHLTDIYDYLTTRKYFIHNSFNILSRSFFSGSDMDHFYMNYSFHTPDDRAYAEEQLARYVGYTQGHRTSYTKAVHESTVGVLYNRTLTSPLCNIFERNLIMRHNGDLALCFQSGYPPVGNGTAETFDLKQVWEGLHTQRLRSRMAQCLKSCGALSCNNKHLNF